MNGDGYSDVIVGAWLYSNVEGAEGRAFIYHGSAAGINSTAVTTVESNQVNANLGIAVAGAGDVNGDGYSDVIVGSQLFDNGTTDEVPHDQSHRQHPNRSLNKVVDSNANFPCCTTHH